MRPDGATIDLFAEQRQNVPLAEGAVLLTGFALPLEHKLIAGIADVAAAAPFRHMETRGGRMSVAMTNCGDVGWVTDRTGYRYDAHDPLTGKAWPAMPARFVELSAAAAGAAGFSGFSADACLINLYEPGARMSLHQDRDEQEFAAPIVSVSLGLPATFLWGGHARKDRPVRVPLLHGDVVVWGGAARMTFHGVDPLADGDHPLTGKLRYNMTFRRAR